MYTAIDLKDLTIKPRINDITLKVLADYYKMFLIPFIYNYTLEDNGILKNVNLRFNSENFCHLLGIEAIAKDSVPYKKRSEYKGKNGWNNVYGNNQNGFIIDIQ